MTDTKNITMEEENITTSYLKHGDNMSEMARPYPHPAQEVRMWTITSLTLGLNLIVFVVLPRMKTNRPGTIYGIVRIGLKLVVMRMMLPSFKTKGEVATHIYILFYTHMLYSRELEL